MTLLEVLAAKGIQFRRSGVANEINLCCPFPGCGDTRFRLGLNIRKNVGHCYNCDWRAGGNAIQRILGYLGSGLQVTLVEQEVAAPEDPKLPEDFTLLEGVEDTDFELWRARKYLLKRGITPKQICRYYFGASLNGKLAYRIVMPVIYNGYFMGTVNRDWTGTQEPKYLNSVGQKSIWNCRKKKQGKTLILCEGILKALAVERHLLQPSAALLGTSITGAMMDQLSNNGHETVAILPDPDRPGITGTLKTMDKLRDAGFTVLYPKLLPSAQADEMTVEELTSVVASLTTLNWSAVCMHTLAARSR